MASSSPLVVSLVLLLAMAARSSAKFWCVCKQELSDDVLQKTLDFACGNGADCNPIQPGGPCFNPNNVQAHCSYAVNSFYQRNHQLITACRFSGAATIVTYDPGTFGCVYPSPASKEMVGV